MIIRLAIKTGLVGASIYYTKEAGVWGDSEQTAKLHADLKKFMCPYYMQVRKQIPIDTPNIPDSGEVCALTRHYYNAGVKNSINFIHRMPCYLGQWAKKGSDAVKQALEPPPPAGEKKAAAPEGKK